MSLFLAPFAGSAALPWTGDMYTQFFGHKKKPFALSAAPEFFYLSKGHHLAFTHLEYGLVHNVGFIALTGDVGTGKTTLLRYLLKSIRAPLNIAMIFNTQVDPASFLEMVVKEFEITPASNRKSDLYEGLYKFFLDQYRKHSRCVIIVDEAQNLQLEGFEELRMLSNLDAGDEPLVQIILVGQPQLRARLSHPSLEQLTQRISVHYHLSPLQQEDVGKYIDFRLQAAGYEGSESIFDPVAVELAAGASRGVPRIINTICDASLTYAYADGVKKVSGEMVENVLADNQLLGVVSSLGESAPGDSNGEARGLPPVAPEGEGRYLSSLVPGFGVMLSNLVERVASLEDQVAESKQQGMDRAVGILQEMLSKERERASQYAAQLIEMKQKYKKAIKDGEAPVVRSASAAESGARNNSRPIWRYFLEKR